MRTYGLSGFLFLCGFIFGTHVIYNSKISVHTHSRLPASTFEEPKKTIPYRMLLQSQKTDVLLNARMLVDNEFVGIELGQFIQKDHKGEAHFACSKYTHVKLKFLAFNETQSTMVISAPCVDNIEKNKIEPIWFSTTKIAQEKPQNTTLQYFDRAPISIEFSSMPSDALPNEWYLNEIELVSTELDTEPLVISSAEVKMTLKNNPFKINFAKLNY